MAKMLPGARSMAFMRKVGYQTAMVERWNPFARIRQDLFNFIDIIAMREGEPILAIQATSKQNISARVKKIQENENAVTWLRTGNYIFVHGWGKRKSGNREYWRVDIREIYLKGGKCEQKTIVTNA